MSVSQSHIINSLYWCLVFSYLFLYLFPFPFSSIPLLNYVAIPWEFCIQPLISGTAAYCFHVQPDWSSAASGSGDQLVRYIVSSRLKQHLLKRQAENAQQNFLL